MTSASNASAAIEWRARRLLDETLQHPGQSVVLIRKVRPIAIAVPENEQLHPRMIS